MESSICTTVKLDLVGFVNKVRVIILMIMNNGRDVNYNQF